MTSDEIKDALLSFGEVNLKGIGRLVVRNSPARVGRNPRTGDKIDIPACRRVAFVQSRTMRDALNPNR